MMRWFGNTDKIKGVKWVKPVQIINWQKTIASVDSEFLFIFLKLFLILYKSNGNRWLFYVKLLLLSWLKTCLHHAAYCAKSSEREFFQARQYLQIRCRCSLYQQSNMALIVFFQDWANVDFTSSFERSVLTDNKGDLFMHWDRKAANTASHYMV